MIGHKLQSAIDKRASILGAGTDALRLIDGEGDSLPGLYLDTLAGRWLVSTTASELDTEVLTWLKGQGDKGRTIYWKQLDQHEKTNPTHIAGPRQDEAFTIKESGVDYLIGFSIRIFPGDFPRSAPQPSASPRSQ